MFRIAAALAAASVLLAVLRPSDCAAEIPERWPPADGGAVSSARDPGWTPAVLLATGARGNAGNGEPSIWYGAQVRAPGAQRYSVLAEAGATRSRSAVYGPAPCNGCAPLLKGHETEHTPYWRAGLGYFDDRLDAVVGLGNLGGSLDGFARATARWGQRFVRIGIRDGFDLAVPQELARLAGGTYLDAGPFPIDVSISAMAMRSAGVVEPNFDIGLGATWSGLRATARVSTTLFTVAVGYSPATTPKAPRVAELMAEPVRAAAAPEPVFDAVPAFNAVATKGRELTFVTKGMPTAMTRCVLVQRRDFYPEGRQVALLRFACTDGLPEVDKEPYDGPQLVRTGCYTLDAQGLWRVPACPDTNPTGPLQRRVLVVPSAAWLRNPSTRFHDMTARYMSTRTVQVDGKPVTAYCAAQFLEGLDEVCAADEFGLLWARTKAGQSVSLAAVATADVAVEEYGRFGSLTGGDLACSLSSPCAAIGHCHHVDGRCLALGNGDCAAAQCCSINGACTSKNGDCVAADDASCSASEVCRARGRCAAVDGRCRTTRAEHCEGALVCRDHGRCAVLSGECVVGSDADCQRSSGCFSDGLCVRRGLSCAALQDEHCAKSLACASDERCRAENGRCVR